MSKDCRLTERHEKNSSVNFTGKASSEKSMPLISAMRPPSSWPMIKSASCTSDHGKNKLGDHLMVLTFHQGTLVRKEPTAPRAIRLPIIEDKYIRQVWLDDVDDFFYFSVNENWDSLNTKFIYIELCYIGIIS